MRPARNFLIAENPLGLKGDLRAVSRKVHTSHVDAVRCVSRSCAFDAFASGDRYASSVFDESSSRSSI